MPENNIERYMEEYATLFRNKVLGDFVSSPALVIFMEKNVKLSDLIEETVNKRVANPSDISFVRIGTNSGENGDIIAERCRTLVSRGNTSGRINIFIVTECNTANEGAYSDIYTALEGISFLDTRIYNIAVVNELDTNENVENAKKILSILKDDSKSTALFVLSRKKNNGQLLPEKRIIKDYESIISSLIINIDNMGYISGMYSLGISLFEDCIKDFYIEVLDKSNSPSIQETAGSISEELQSKPDMAKYLSEINNIIMNGYKTGIGIGDMGRILINKDCIDNADRNDIEKSIKLLFGRALDVYIENEKDRADKAVESISVHIKKLAEAMLNDLGEHTQYAKDIADILNDEADKRKQYINTLEYNGYDGNNMFDVMSDSIAPLLNNIYNEYIKPKTDRILEDHYIKAFKKAAEIIKQCAENREAVFSYIDEEKNLIHSYAIEHINRESPLGMGSIPEFHLQEMKANYINGLCSEINRALKNSNAFNNFFDENGFAILDRLKNKAEIYCKSASYGMEDNYFFFGSNYYFQKFSTMQTSENTKGIQNKGIENVIMLNCCKIDIDSLIDWL